MQMIREGKTMEKAISAVRELRKNPRKMRLCILAIVLVIAVLATVCISIHMQRKATGAYAHAIAMIQEQIYQGMIEMTQTYSYINDPTVDVQNKLIPELRAKYSAVSALNTALNKGFDGKHAVLDENMISRLDNAFSQYAAAYKSMEPTGLAAANMKSCIDDMKAMITARYEDHSNDPIVIASR